MSVDTSTISGLHTEQEAVDSEAATLTPSDPFRSPIVSCTAKNNRPLINIYPFSRSEILPEYEPLFNESRKIIRKNIEKAFGTESGNISYDLLMCGTCPETAEPALVIKCAMNVVDKVQKVINQKRLLRHCHLRPTGITRLVCNIKQSLGLPTDDNELFLGLEIYGCGTATRPPVRTELAGGIPNVADIELSESGSCQHFSSFHGAKVNVTEEDVSSTLSGVVQIADKLYGLTTSHVYRKKRYIKSRLSRMHRIGNMKGWTLPVEVILPGHTQGIRTKIWIPSIVSFGEAVPNLDWALVILDDTIFYHHSLKMDACASGSIAASISASILASKHALKHPGIEPEVLILSFGEKPKKATLLSGTSYYANRISGEVAVWNLALDESHPVQKGDSGSLVIEADTGVAYGYLVAQDTFGRGEIIPLCNTLDQIRNLTGFNHVVLADEIASAKRQNPICTMTELILEQQSTQSKSSGSLSVPVENNEFTPSDKDNTASIGGSALATVVEKERALDLAIHSTSSSARSFPRDNCTIGIICALDRLAAINILLDEEHHFEQGGSTLVYNLGRIGSYNAVIAYLASDASKTTLGIASVEMMYNFPSIRFTLLVGFDSSNSLQVDRAHAVSYDRDLGVYEERRQHWHNIYSTDLHDKSSKILTAFHTSIVEHVRSLSRHSLSKDCNAYLGQTIVYDNCQEEPFYDNRGAKQITFALEQDVKRQFLYHSAAIKSDVHRDRLVKQDGIIPFEMEGHSTWEVVPTIIVKATSDYADSHKNKIWQNYAATVAAAGLKAFLETLNTSDWVRTPTLHRQQFYPSITKELRNHSLDVFCQGIMLLDTLVALKNMMDPLDPTYSKALQRSQSDLPAAPVESCWLSSNKSQEKSYDQAASMLAMVSLARPLVIFSMGLLRKTQEINSSSFHNITQLKEWPLILAYLSEKLELDPDHYIYPQDHWILDPDVQQNLKRMVKNQCGPMGISKEKVSKCESLIFSADRMLTLTL